MRLVPGLSVIVAVVLTITAAVAAFDSAPQRPNWPAMTPPATRGSTDSTPTVDPLGDLLADLGELNSIIQSLPDSAFKNNPSQRKNALENKINALEHQFASCSYAGALDKMENDLRAKADGSFGGQPNNDWIIEPGAQAAVFGKILAIFAADYDGDGLSLEEEVRTFGTNPFSSDSDGDRLLDGEEVALYGTDPLNPDTDADGVTDGDEVLAPEGVDPESIFVRTDPLNPDTDGDGLTDGEERYTYGTRGFERDTDKDDIADGDEVAFWLALGKSAASAGANSRRPDTDGDGMRDGREIPYYPALDPEVDDAAGDADGDGISNANEVNKYLTSPTTATTYGWLDDTRRRFLDGVGLEFADADTYARGFGFAEPFGIDYFELTAAAGTTDAYAGGFFTLHIHHADAAAVVSITLRMYDKPTNTDDTGDAIGVSSLRDETGAEVPFTVSQTDATYTITSDAAQPVMDYRLAWTVLEDGDQSTLRVTSTDQMHYVCPDPSIGTYPAEIAFTNGGGATPLFFIGHTQRNGYVSSLVLNGGASITTTTAAGNPLYKNSEFSYPLGTLSGSHIITFNWVVTGTNAEFQFRISDTGWSDPDANDLDNDDISDYDEADLMSDPEVPDLMIEVNWEAGVPTVPAADIEDIFERVPLVAALYPDNPNIQVTVLMDGAVGATTACTTATNTAARNAHHNLQNSHTFLFFADDDCASNAVGNAAPAYGTFVYEGDIQEVVTAWGLDATDTARLRLDVTAHELGHTMDAGITDDIGCFEVYSGNHAGACVDGTSPPNRITRGDINHHWSIMAGGSNRQCHHSTPTGTCRPYALFDVANGSITMPDGTLVANVQIFDDEDWGTVHLDDRWSVD